MIASTSVGPSYCRPPPPPPPDPVNYATFMERITFMFFGRVHTVKMSDEMNELCSLLPDASSGGVGTDWGIGITESAQLNLTANGASGELTLSLSLGLSGGVIGPDAYVSASVTPNAPDNSCLDSHGELSPSINAGYGRVGYSGGGGTHGGTFGPSLLTIPTASVSLMASKPLINLPYVGYLAQPLRAVCRAVTGH